VDLDELSAFCKLPAPEYWNSPAKPQTDRWPQNMVNRITDWWKAEFVFSLDKGAPTFWDMELPRQEKIDGFSIIPSLGYDRIRSLRLEFDDGRAEDLTVQETATRQDFQFDPHATGKVRVRITDWTPATTPVLGVSELWIRAARPEGFSERVQPLASIGVLVKYARGQGGIVLNQLAIPAPNRIAKQVDAAGEAAAAQAKENERDDAQKKALTAARAFQTKMAAQRQALLRKLLQNLGAGVVASAPNPGN